MPDWRGVAELFRAALRADGKQAPNANKAPKAQEIADYNVDRLRLKCRSPRIAVRFMDGEAGFTHVPSAPGKPLNIGQALRVAIAMYRSRQAVQHRLGFRSTTMRYQSLRFFRFAVWRRTNCSTWTRVASRRRWSVRAATLNARWRCSALLKRLRLSWVARPILGQYRRANFSSSAQPERP